jgi:dihydroneopterin aldolase
MDYIILDGIKIHAHHGCLKEEAVLGTDFVVSVKMGLDLSVAGRSGRIEDTVNYAEVHALILEEMQKPEKIIEAVAHRIAERIMNEFPLVRELEFRLAKLHPPLPGETERSIIILNRNR